jgi:GT2 family glycosyltransferase
MPPMPSMPPMPPMPPMSSRPQPATAATAATAVVLVNWNGAADTLDTLTSLDRAEGREGLRVVVVDNGSTDGSAERLRRERPDVEVIESGGNLGFAGGNDVGIRHVLADPAIERVLLLNTDVAVDPGFLSPLFRAVDDPRVAAAGPKIFYFDPPDRLWAAGGRLRIRETVTVEYGRGRLDGPEWSRPADVTYLTTCCLLVTRRALETVGLFDPAYFINVDDADWCRRALDLNLALRYVPESRIWHKVAASTAGSYTPMKTFHTGRSNALYVRRHGGALGLAGFVAANLVTLPYAWLRELSRGNARAAVAKARGVFRGLTEPLPPLPSPPEPPRLDVSGKSWGKA